MNILTGQTASKHLRASGNSDNQAEKILPGFLLTWHDLHDWLKNQSMNRNRNKDTYPGDPARWVILVQPVPHAVTAAATAGLLGKVRTVHSKPATA